MSKIDKRRAASFRKKHKKWLDTEGESERYRCPSGSDFAKAGKELEEMKKESAHKRSKSVFIGAVATFLISLIGLLCDVTDASHYVAFPATITDVSLIKHPYSIFGGRFSNGLYHVDEYRAMVQYYIDSVEYQSSIKITSTLYGTHTTIYCNKNNPQQCRSTQYWWPILHKFLIACCIAGAVIMILFRQSTRK